MSKFLRGSDWYSVLPEGEVDLFCDVFNLSKRNLEKLINDEASFRSFYDILEALRDLFEESMMRTWASTNNPVLDKKTPREVVKSREGFLKIGRYMGSLGK